MKIRRVRYKLDRHNSFNVNDKEGEFLQFSTAELGHGLEPVALIETPFGEIVMTTIDSFYFLEHTYAVPNIFNKD